MTPVTVCARDLQPGDVIMWDSRQCFVESIDKSFCASVKVKLHNFWLEKHWPPAQQVIKFNGLPIESEAQK